MSYKPQDHDWIPHAFFEMTDWKYPYTLVLWCPHCETYRYQYGERIIITPMKNEQEVVIEKSTCDKCRGWFPIGTFKRVERMILCENCTKKALMKNECCECEKPSLVRAPKDGEHFNFCGVCNLPIHTPKSWQERFDEKFGVLLDWGYGDEFNADQFKDFIEEELTKARQAGRDDACAHIEKHSIQDRTFDHLLTVNKSIIKEARHTSNEK